jgi:hypothetical protein
MSLIFDRFADLKHAEAFRNAVQEQYPEQPTQIWMDQEEMETLFWRQVGGQERYGEPLADCIIFPLTPPIVLIERFETFKTEREIEALVTRYGGEWAGT